MWKLTISSIRAQKARFFLTSVAVILGVAFMAGTLVLTDTIKQSYDDIAGDVYKPTDAVVQSTHAGQRRHRAGGAGHASTPRSSTGSRQCPGVAVAEAQVTGVAEWSAGTATCSTAAATGRCRSRSGWQSDQRLNPMQLVDGHAPAATEVVIDVASAAQG